MPSKYDKQIADGYQSVNEMGKQNDNPVNVVIIIGTFVPWF